MDQFLRRDFLLAAGALSLSGCGGAASSLIGSTPRSNGQGTSLPAQSAKNTLSFANDYFKIDVGLQADGSVTMQSGGSPLVLHAGARSGAPIFTRDGVSHALPLPTSPTANAWYTDAKQQLYQRFNSSLGRAEATNGRDNLVAVALGPSGLQGGLKLGGSTGPRGSVTIPVAQLADIITNARSLVNAVGPRPAASSASFAQRAVKYDAFVRRQLAESAARKIQDYYVTTCYTAAVVDSQGNILASNTNCNEYLVVTNGGPENTGGGGGGGGGGFTGNPLVDCILDAILVVFGAATVEALLAGLLTSAQVATFVSVVSGGTLAIEAWLATLFQAAVTAFAVYVLAQAISAAYSTCSAAGV